MNRNYLKLPIVFMACAAAAMLGCAPKQTPLIDIAPQNASVAAWGKTDAKLTAQLRQRADYKQLMAELKSSAKIKSELAKILAEAEKGTKGISSIFISKDDPIGSIEEIIFDSVDEVLIYTDEKIDSGDGAPSFSAILRLKSKKFSQKVGKALEAFAANNKGARIAAADGKPAYLLCKEWGGILARAEGLNLIVASQKRFEQTVKNLANPPKENIAANEKFARLAGGDNGNFLFFLDCTAFGADVEKQATAVFASGKCDSLERGTLKIKAELAENSEALKFMRGYKLLTPQKTAAMPMSQAYVALALPNDIAQLAKNASKLTEDPMVPMLAQFANDIREIEFSVCNYGGKKGADGDRMPSGMAVLTVEDSAKLLNSPSIEPYIKQMMFAPQEIDGAECLVSPIGAAIIKVSPKKLALTFSKDLKDAVKYASGKTAAPQDKLLENLKTDADTFCKFYFDENILFANEPDDEKGYKIHAALQKMYKAYRIAGSLTTKGNVVELDLDAFADIDFNALLQELKK